MRVDYHMHLEMGSLSLDYLESSGCRLKRLT